MYNANLILNKTEYSGKLDFFVLKNIQTEFFKEFEEEVKIVDIFEKLSNFDMKMMVVFIMETLNRNGSDKKEIYKDFSSEQNLLSKFVNCYTYINEIIQKCMPKNSKKKTNKFEDEFEDEEDIDGIKDWEFDWMEYMWTTTLKRNDFWSTTPKNFFEQLNIYKRVNKVEENSENVEYI